MQRTTASPTGILIAMAVAITLLLVVGAGALLLFRWSTVQAEVASMQQAEQQRARLRRIGEQMHMESGKAIDSAAQVKLRIELIHTAEAGHQLQATGLGSHELDEIRRQLADDHSQSEIFSVRVAGDDSDELPAMLGALRVAEDRLVFEPRYPFRPGLEYRATLNLVTIQGATDEPARTAKLDFSLPEPPPGPPAFVDHVYPSTDTLPENQLKFYIHFSAPMSRGEAYDRIHLLRRSHGEVAYPFLELGEELWNEEGTRFTLLFDPGRIKRGLKPREDEGSSLLAGNEYTLVIDGGWLDADGHPLKSSHRKTFTVVEPDETTPDPDHWEWSPPPADSQFPLGIRFDEPLDHAMLGRVLRIIGPEGRELFGSVEIADQETRWLFHPSEPWQAGAYELAVDTTLEDRAGNSIGRPFEVDMQRPDDDQPPPIARLPFEVKAD